MRSCRCSVRIGVLLSDGLVAVPSVVDLVARGLAEVFERNKKGEPIAFVISSEGYEVMYSAMKHNARLLSSDVVLRKASESKAVRDAKSTGGKK